MDRASLDLGRFPEHPLHAGGQSLAAVEHAEHALFSRQAPGHQVGQQVGDHHLVLGVPEPQSDRHLGAVGGDDQGHHAALTGHIQPVDHEDGHVEVGEAAGHQILHRLLGGRDEASGDGGLGGGAGPGLDVGAHRFGHVHVAAGGHPGQHPFDDERVEQVGRAERLPGVELDLPAVGAPGPGPFRGHRPSTEDHRTRGRPVPVPGAFDGRDPGVLRPDPTLELGLHHLVHDDEPGGRGERHQPVLDRPGHLGQGHGRLNGQVSHSGRLLRLGDGHNSYFLLHGGPLPHGLLGRARSLPVGRSQAGDHRFTSTMFGTSSFS